MSSISRNRRVADRANKMPRSLSRLERLPTELRLHIFESLVMPWHITPDVMHKHACWSGLNPIAETPDCTPTYPLAALNAARASPIYGQDLLSIVNKAFGDTYEMLLTSCIYIERLRMDLMTLQYAYYTEAIIRKFANRAGEGGAIDALKQWAGEHNKQVAIVLRPAPLDKHFDETYRRSISYVVLPKTLTAAQSRMLQWTPTKGDPVHFAAKVAALALASGSATAQRELFPPTCVRFENLNALILESAPYETKLPRVLCSAIRANTNQATPYVYSLVPQTHAQTPVQVQAQAQAQSQAQAQVQPTTQNPNAAQRPPAKRRPQWYMRFLQTEVTRIRAAGAYEAMARDLYRTSKHQLIVLQAFEEIALEWETGKRTETTASWAEDTDPITRMLLKDAERRIADLKK